VEEDPAVSAGVSREWETPVVILAVITMNTVLNYVQEARAESSLQALRDMSIAYSRVRRDGGTRRIPRSELVPGDVVLLESIEIPTNDLPLYSPDYDKTIQTPVSH
jgi:Ca2+-transporting ATPase